MSVRTQWVVWVSESWVTALSKAKEIEAYLVDFNESLSV